MNEHINHPRLTYSFGAGGASVNIRTGRPLVNIPGGTIGTGDYAISISHVYSPDLFSKADTALGNKWKLNIEQFLFRKFEYQNLKAEEFQYIDAEGQLHTFLYLKHNGDDYQYYDTTGLNLILYVTGPSYNITTQVIKDTAGNEMIFSKEGKLIRTEAAEKNQDPSKQIRKKFDYDVNGKLVSVYDERNISRRINLKYLDGLLNIIEYLHNYKIFVRYYYEYDQNKNLIAIVRKAENEVDYPLYFKYDKNDQLQSALDRRDSSAIGFTYETE